MNDTYKYTKYECYICNILYINVIYISEKFLTDVTFFRWFLIREYLQDPL